MPGIRDILDSVPPLTVKLVHVLSEKVPPNQLGVALPTMENIARAPGRVAHPLTSSTIFFNGCPVLRVLCEGRARCRWYQEIFVCGIKETRKKQLVGERGFEPPTPCSRIRETKSISLARLGFHCVVVPGFVRCLAAFGLK